MIRIFRRGTVIPKWLVKQKPDQDKPYLFTPMRITFGTLVFVVKIKGSFHIVPIIRRNCVIKMRHGMYSTVVSQGNKAAVVHKSFKDFIKYLCGHHYESEELH